MGRVVDATLRPVSGGEVAAYEGSGMTFGAIVPTLPSLGVQVEIDAEGRFWMAEVPATRELILRLKSPAFAQIDAGPYNVRPGTELNLGDIVVRPGVLIHGVVQDPAGLPVDGARVGLHYSTMSGDWFWAEAEPALMVITDAQGNFEFRNARRGSYGLVADKDGFARALAKASVPVDPKIPGEAWVTLRMVKPQSISGRVFGSPGAIPLADAKVVAAPLAETKGASAGYARTGPDGSYEISDIADGLYTVSAEAPGYKRRAIQIETGDRRKAGDIRLPRLGSITGIVVDPQGDPVTHFDIQVRKHFRVNIGGAKFGEHQRFIDSHGEFTVVDLPTGFFSFEVWGRGYAVTQTEAVYLGRTEDMKGLVVELSVGSSLTGRVLTDGGPVADAKVEMHLNKESGIDFLRVEKQEPSYLQSAFSDEDGWFVMEGVTPGTYQLEVAHPDFAYFRQNDVQIWPESEVTLPGPLMLQRGAVIRGLAVNLHGEARSGATVHLNGGGGMFLRERTDGQGRFRFERLPAGVYTLSVAASRPLTFTEAWGAQMADIKNPGATGFTVNVGETVERNVISQW